MKYLTVLAVTLLLASGHTYAQSVNVEELQAQLEQQKEELQKLKDNMMSSKRDLEMVQDKIKSSDYKSLQLNEKIDSLCAKLNETSAGKVTNPVCVK